jgi:hypothetical protein
LFLVISEEAKVQETPSKTEEDNDRTPNNESLAAGGHAGILLTTFSGRNLTLTLVVIMETINPSLKHNDASSNTRPQ